QRMLQALIGSPRSTGRSKAFQRAREKGLGREIAIQALPRVFIRPRYFLAGQVRILRSRSAGERRMPCSTCKKLRLTFVKVADLIIASNQQVANPLDILLAERVTGADMLRQWPLHVDGRMMRRDFFRRTPLCVVIHSDRSPRQMLLVGW